MKKIALCAILAACVFAFTACKSTKKADSASPKNAESADSSETTKKTDSKGTLGWMKGSRRSIDLSFGNMRLRIKSKFGSFSIGVINEKGKTVSALSTANEFTTNAFYLKSSKRTYNLVTDSSVSATGKKTSDGADILYDIKGVAQVLVDFKCFSSEKKKNNDMIKVTATIKNNGKQTEDFSLKAVLDTLLGEGDTYHFYTWENVSVKNEVLYRTLQNQKWFVSKNPFAAMQLFFTGAEATTPELVALANYSTLERHSWEPDMLSYRAFDTVLSYNNSAVCAIWKPCVLAPSETASFVFYMAFAADGASPQGEKYVYSKEYTEKLAAEAQEAVAEEKSKNQQIVSEPETETSDKEPVVPENNAVVETLTEPQEEETKKPSEVPTVDFYIKNMSKEQLTPEYIQGLIDRISALEENSPSLNREELLQLNAELDAILTYLRQ